MCAICTLCYMMYMLVCFDCTHAYGVLTPWHGIQGVDIELYNSLNWMKENSITDIVFETFSVTSEQGEVAELKPGGSGIEVTDENKIE